MRLTRSQQDAIAAGRKTQHRIPATYGTTTWRRYRVINGARRHYGPLEERPKENRPKLGANVSLGEGRRAVILEVHEDVELTEPTRAMAKAEGHGNQARAVAEYRKAWLEAHDRVFVREQQATDLGLTDEVIAARFTAKHVGRRIHVVVMTTTEEHTRYLAPVSGTTQDPKRSIDPEASVIDPEPAYVKRAAEVAVQQRAAKQEEIADRRAARDLARAPWKRKEAA